MTRWTDWAMLLYMVMLVTSHLVVLATWREGYLNGWPPMVQLASVGEQWVEGALWHGMVAALPVALWWLCRRLRS